ncbi:MAG: hypothetical protein BGO11_14910 [Solirubrobacterales bacterium 70-9]|nr:MAG: hypothetical protein BGO11_14910 [Solirubrobacterales bacterium 70-9]
MTTDPPSSEAAAAHLTLPSILGEAEPKEEATNKVAPFFGAQLSLTTRAVENPTLYPGYEIQIFESSDCSGPVVSHGTAEALEGVGIPVPVAADSVTTFSAKQVSASHEESGCSNELTYWEGNFPPPAGGGGGEAGKGETGGGGTSEGSSGGSSSSGSSSSGKSSSGGSVGEGNPAGPKPAAPTLHLIPGERANSATPSVAGSSPGANAVSVYASGNCSGTPVAKGTPAQLSAGFQVSVTKNSATTFSAVAIGARHSGCSDPVTYTEDSLAPRTRITMAPGVKTRKRKAVFRFTDITEDPPGTTFKCKVDKAKWKPCASPFKIKHLKLGHHTVSIRATDTAGNVERKPVKRSFIVVPPSGA